MHLMNTHDEEESCASDIEIAEVTIFQAAQLLYLSSLISQCRPRLERRTRKPPFSCGGKSVFSVKSSIFEVGYVAHFDLGMP